jgi:hypothetical protein
MRKLQSFDENQTQRDQQEDLDVDGRIKSKWFVYEYDGCRALHSPGSEQRRWRDLMDVELNFRIPRNVRNILSSSVTNSLSRGTQIHGVS